MGARDSKQSGHRVPFAHAREPSVPDGTEHGILRASFQDIVGEGFGAGSGWRASAHHGQYVCPSGPVRAPEDGLARRHT